MIFIDVYTPIDTRTLSGPIANIVEFEYTAEIDAIGTFTFQTPLTEDNYDYNFNHFFIRAYIYLGNSWQHFMTGIIHDTQRKTDDTGRTVLEVSGNCILKELTRRSYTFLFYDYPLVQVRNHEDAVDDLATYAPSGWTFSEDPSPPTDTVREVYKAENILKCCQYVNLQCGTHFYGGVDREITFFSTFADSGLVLTSGQAVDTDNHAVIQAIEVIRDTTEYFNRVYPIATGGENDPLHIGSYAGSLPSGYAKGGSLYKTYIEHTFQVFNYGVVEKYLEFSDIIADHGGGAEETAVTQELVDRSVAALEDAIKADEQVLLIDAVGAPAHIQPGTSAYVDYFDIDNLTHYQGTYNVLANTMKISEDGLAVQSLTLSTGDRLNKTDNDKVADILRQSLSFTKTF